jgi:uncharacterized protein YndB with AHSA1/START domain
MNVTREIVLPLDRDDAWDALVDLESWLAQDSDLELEAGERGTLGMPGGEQRDALVEEVTDGERLVLWWRDADGPRDQPMTRVALTLDEVAGGTLVRVVESAPPLPVGLPETITAGPRMLAGTGAGGGGAPRTAGQPLGIAAAAVRSLGRVAA